MKEREIYIYKEMKIREKTREREKKGDFKRVQCYICTLEIQ